MDDISIFQDKTIEPTEEGLIEKLGANYSWWIEIREFVMANYPAGTTEWKYPGQKYGWNYRIKDKNLPAATRQLFKGGVGVRAKGD